MSGQEPKKKETGAAVRSAKPKPKPASDLLFSAAWEAEARAAFQKVEQALAVNENRSEEDNAASSGLGS